MVTGIDSFKEWFKGSEEQYAIIGGTACDILMMEDGLDFRATKDIDLVLIIEAVDANFGKRFYSRSLENDTSLRKRALPSITPFEKVKPLSLASREWLYVTNKLEGG